MADFPWLTRGIRQALPLIQRSAREGLSRRATARALRASGYRFRDSALSEAYAYYSSYTNTRSYVASLKREQVPDPSLLPVAAGKIRRRYSFRVGIEGINLNTGALEQRFVTITSNRLMSRGEIEDMAADLVAEDSDAYAMEVTAATFYAGLQAGDVGTL